MDSKYDEKKEDKELAISLVAASLRQNCPTLQAHHTGNDGTIVFLARNSAQAEYARAFNLLIGYEVDELQVAEKRLVNSFSHIVELRTFPEGSNFNIAETPRGCLALALRDADGRGVVLLEGRHGTTINHSGKPQVRAWWLGVVEEMRRIYNTPGLIRFKVV